MNKDAKIYVAGHRGLVGSAIVRRLQGEGYTNIIIRTHEELDLTNQGSVKQFFEKETPQYVFVAAAKVGGILANNTYPADFIYINLMIQANVIHNAYLYGVDKLLFLGSSCIYPKFATQPMKEEYLLSGELEPTNEPYALAKIAGIKTCQSYNRQYKTNFISIMPTNLYGPYDNFDLRNSHVIPALISKFHSAKIKKESVILWGTGKPRREFLHVDDMANACVFLINNYDQNEIINVGSGFDITIKELAESVADVVGFTGDIIWDSSKPDGHPRKLLDVSKLTALGWQPVIGLKEGLTSTYKWFLENQPNI
ncbi:MAG: GDP-L-fucose synthase [Candidatus Magnetoovum sp. WYHC-5]|nr:GDP-L-fucose synthase [Candidatus Magnetoovum sp. WYHC-5]